MNTNTLFWHTAPEIHDIVRPNKNLMFFLPPANIPHSLELWSSFCYKGNELQWKLNSAGNCFQTALSTILHPANHGDE